MPPFKDSTPKDVHFWLTNLKIFVKAPWAPIYTNLEGRARAEKNAIFLI